MMFRIDSFDNRPAVRNTIIPLPFSHPKQTKEPVPIHILKLLVVNPKLAKQAILAITPYKSDCFTKTPPQSVCFAA